MGQNGGSNDHVIDSKLEVFNLWRTKNSFLPYTFQNVSEKVYFVQIYGPYWLVNNANHLYWAVLRPRKTEIVSGHPLRILLHKRISGESDMDQRPEAPVGGKSRSQPIPLIKRGKRGKIVNKYCNKHCTATIHIYNQLDPPRLPPTHPITTSR